MRSMRRRRITFRTTGASAGSAVLIPSAETISRSAGTSLRWDLRFVDDWFVTPDLAPPHAERSASNAAAVSSRAAR